MKKNYPLSIAPMMDWTDRHYRFFMRQITRHTLLYTEMVTTGAIIHGDKKRHLDFSLEELPLALQLGGDSPQALAECAKIGEDWGYSEINLNVGCPSDRVQNGNFGACLMRQPELVAECIAAMKSTVKIPVTVKHRIGIDELDRYEDMANFVAVVSKAGADRFSVHARKAWLSGLSPKENRTIPPLRYDDVYKLKREFPELVIEINGGVLTLEQARHHLNFVDGVMTGRAAYENPFLLATVDSEFYQSGGQTESSKGLNPLVESSVTTRREVLEHMLPYIEHWTNQDIYLKHISRHMLGLFTSKPGAKAWKRYLSENAHKSEAGVNTVLEAMKQVSDEVLDERPVISTLATRV
ncbi:MAG: tRNA dihydrouridine(20/20a) synthase DusA [Trueperaceae bacterium]